MWRRFIYDTRLMRHTGQAEASNNCLQWRRLKTENKRITVGSLLWLWLWLVCTVDVRKDVINPILCVLVLPSSTPFLVLIGNLGSNSTSLCYGYCPMWIDGSGGVWWLLNILDWKLNRRQWWREMEKSVFKTQQTEISEKPSVTNLTFLSHCNLCCTGRNKDMTGGPHTQMQQLIKAPWHWGERKCVYSLESTFIAVMDRIGNDSLIAYSGRMEFYKQRI